jgi:hypothetical protein
MWHYSFCLTRMRLNAFIVVLNYSGSCCQYEVGERCKGFVVGRRPLSALRGQSG